ncbi:hypothetical protein RCL1_001200 [Eukaryota sp. TZLM3-RCL]
MDLQTDVLLCLEALNIKPTEETARFFLRQSKLVSSIPAVHIPGRSRQTRIQERLINPLIASTNTARNRHATIQQQNQRRISESDSNSSISLQVIRNSLLDIFAVFEHNATSTYNYADDTLTGYWMKRCFSPTCLSFLSSSLVKEDFLSTKSLYRFLLTADSLSVVDFSLWRNGSCDANFVDTLCNYLDLDSHISELFVFFLVDAIVNCASFGVVLRLYTVDYRNIHQIIRARSFIQLCWCFVTIFVMFLTRKADSGKQKFFHLLDLIPNLVSQFVGKHHPTLISVTFIVIRLAVVSVAAMYYDQNKNRKDFLDGVDEFLLLLLDHSDLYRQPTMNLPFPMTMDSKSNLAFFNRQKQFLSRTNRISSFSSITSNNYTQVTALLPYLRSTFAIEFGKYLYGKVRCYPKKDVSPNKLRLL